MGQETLTDEYVNIDISSLSIDNTISLFSSKKTGLTEDEAKKRLLEYGENKLPEKDKKSKFQIFLSNFNSPLVYALFAAAIFAAIIGKFVDVGVILAVLVINALIGFIQEVKAEKDIEALKELTSFFVKVIRGGNIKETDADKLVPGDIVMLDEGDRIPADGRLIEVNNLLVNESSLTGESELILKVDHEIRGGKSETPKNMVFQGTVVAEGNGKFVVLATGQETKFGKISLFAQETTAKTPIQKRMEKLSKQIGIAVLITSAFVLAIGMLNGEGAIYMFQLAISLAVSAIPEGLPVAVTIILVLGAKRMAKRKAIIRNMMAVETLGTTTVIATDKTGTLTHNKLKVIEIFSAAEMNYKIDSNEDSKKERTDDLSRIMISAAVCNNAEYSRDKNIVIGEPTDAAILESAINFGVRKALYRPDHEIPFSSEKKFMAVSYADGRKRKVIVKGAPEVVLNKCAYFFDGKNISKLTKNKRNFFEKQVSKMSTSGLRVVSVAEGDFKKGLKSSVRSGLVLLGFIGLKDTYRPGVKEAIERCKTAGIKIVMLTGDHLDTAISIAQKLGIIKKENEAIVAEDIFKKEKLSKGTERFSVFARIMPEYKYKIIDYFKKKGEIVAMTGDGVNDVPALRKADIGIAMGNSGTDAAKEAADMVLVDDNFATIVNAVEEGRTIFENLRKTILYLISTSAGEVFTIIASLVLKLPIPITPLQILWINMITDTSATIPLGVEPKEDDHLKKPPRSPKENIVSRLIVRRSILVGIYMGVVAIYLFSANLHLGTDYARTITFLFLSISQWFNAFNCRSEKRSVFTKNPFSNPWLILGITLGLLAQLAVMYIPAIEHVFGFVPVGPDAWWVAVLASFGLIILVEIDKVVSNLLRKGKYPEESSSVQSRPLGSI